MDLPPPLQPPLPKLVLVMTPITTAATISSIYRRIRFITRRFFGGGRVRCLHLLSSLSGAVANASGRAFVKTL